MSLILDDELSDVEKIKVVTGANVTEGQAAIINTQYGFYLKTGISGESVMFATRAKKVKCDCASLVYTAGEALYDDDTTPTGILNKTSGAGRRNVGYVAIGSEGVAATTVYAVINGGNG